MYPKKFALIGGVIMLALGLFSFLPALNTDPVTAGLPFLSLNAGYGLFLDFFPMNILSKIALIGFGAWGIIASQSKTRALPASTNWASWVFLSMGVLAILGAIPQTNTLGGNWPLFGNEVWAHTVFSLLGGYFGLTLPRKAHANNAWLRDERKDRAA